MHPNLDRIVHGNEIPAARLPLYTISAAVGRKFMAYAIKTKVVEEFVAVSSSSADKPKASVYVLLKPNIASKSVQVGCFFVSDKEVFVFPHQYSAVFLLFF